MSDRAAIFPGCSLEGTSRAFHASLISVMRALKQDCVVLRDWNCCGASAAHTVDHQLYLALCARNLSQAQEQGYGEIIAPCAACYHRLACAQSELAGNPDTLAQINARAELAYSGGVRVVNVLDHFIGRQGAQAIAERVTHSLANLRVACYYGCLNSRVPRAYRSDAASQLTQSEYPMSMDLLARALGAHTVDWSHKTECCGAGMSVTADSISMRLVARILDDAVASGADCICVACPMCHNNLDVKQDAIRAEFGIERPMPILFITQLMGLALGVPPNDLKMKDAFVPFQWPGVVVRTPETSVCHS